MHCSACMGKGRIKAMAPARGNSPMVEVTEVVCGSCLGTGVKMTRPTEDENLHNEDSKKGFEPSESVPLKPLQKPTRTKGLAKVAQNESEKKDNASEA